MRSRTLPAAVTALASLFISSPAFAADKPPKPASSAISQYVEMIPTAGGDRAVGLGKPRTTPLPAPQEKALRGEGGSAANTLQTIATSSSFGAPTKKLRVTENQRRTGNVKRLLHPSRRDATAFAPFSAARTGTGDGRLIVLLAALVVTSLALLAAAIRRGAS